LSLPTHVHVIVSLNPRWLHLPDISIFAIATHFILTHTYVLSPTPTSVHAFTVTFRDMPPKIGFQLAECLLPLQRSPS